MFSLRQSIKNLLGIRTVHERIDSLQQQTDEMPNLVLDRVTLPRFLYHQPFCYERCTYPIDFDPPEKVPGCELPVPAPDDRMGYNPESAELYLASGKNHHDIVMSYTARHAANLDRLSILDFGCSSGRVLRHFEDERRSRHWKLCGVDAQARPIEWIRQFFPQHFEVATCSLIPHLPCPDASFDVVYGMSVFTHIKYLWDAWLLELRRILKPSGLLIQTIAAEAAWECYHHGQQFMPAIRKEFPAEMLDKPHMDVDFFYYGDIALSHVFWKESVARRFWGRYFEILDVAPPEQGAFQHWMICRKSA